MQFRTCLRNKDSQPGLVCQTIHLPIVQPNTKKKLQPSPTEKCKKNRAKNFWKKYTQFKIAPEWQKKNSKKELWFGGGVGIPNQNTKNIIKLHTLLTFIFINKLMLHSIVQKKKTIHSIVQKRLAPVNIARGYSRRCCGGSGRRQAGGP